jgi:hypothetical protein
LQKQTPGRPFAYHHSALRRCAGLAWPRIRWALHNQNGTVTHGQADYLD